MLLKVNGAVIKPNKQKAQTQDYAVQAKEMKAMRNTVVMKT